MNCIPIIIPVNWLFLSITDIVTYQDLLRTSG
jgi:hypothetical protein